MRVPSIGCCPYQRSLNDTGGCMEGLNACAQVFLKEFEGLLQNLSSEYPAMQYSLANSYEMTQTIINGSQRSPFKEIQQACCGKGRFNATTRCEPVANLCPKRDDYMFWDQYHPTEFASRLAAALLCSGPQQMVVPMNFCQLYMLDN
ncbi:GDSL esterase/lipase At2g23540-like [Corylus avellana]|uniref:GDSL esterase/lipase At2g23540-like n=1 Tax=Corylus avellana TaxID=13451 RepID=UPI00286D04FD|nr:GDSL esterase/lipase At2g23540-like [Corylus avellana]